MQLWHRDSGVRQHEYVPCGTYQGVQQHENVLHGTYQGVRQHEIIFWMGVEKCLWTVFEKFLLNGHQKMSFGPASKNFFWTGIKKCLLDQHLKLDFRRGSKNFFWKVQTICWLMREEVTNRLSVDSALGCFVIEKY